MIGQKPARREMSDEEMKALTDEERLYKEATEDLRDARKDLKKTRKKLYEWEKEHGDDNDKYRELDQRLNKADQRVKDAHERLKYARDMKSTKDIPVLSIEQIEEAFKTTRDSYIEQWGKNLAAVDLIKLCAYSVAGVAVNTSNKVIGGMSWARVRDSSLCLLQDKKVLIPYAIFHRVADLVESESDRFSDAERCFIECVQGLIEKVDTRIYDKEPWALWEVFGAYFHALRINAMIIVGKPVLQVSELFRGALVKGCEDKVKLVPTRVMQYDGQFGSSIEASIGRYRYPHETHNWLTDGYVVINGDNGKGVDIFFALRKNQNNGYVVCLDQRKRVAGTNHGAVGISNLLSAARIVPTALGSVYDPITVVPLLFSSLRSTNVQELTGQNAVVVTYAQMKSYHHGLWLHPASSP